eukprot:8994962-Heterocapsa_arctica.AAC.1
MENSETRWVGLDRYAKAQTQLICPQLKELEVGLTTLRNLLLSCQNEFIKTYVAQYNEEWGDDARVNHKPFTTVCSALLSEKEEMTTEEHIQK